MEIYLAVVLAIVVIIFTIAFYLQEKNYKELERNYDDVLKKWKEHIEKSNQQKQDLWITIDEMEKENMKLKEQNVSRETSYNPSYGIPEVVDWIDQHQPTGEEIKHG